MEVFIKNIMPEQRESLVGKWERISTSPCSQVYPRLLEFFPNGLYLGQDIQPGPSPGWDSGTYRVVGQNQIKVSTINDAILTYEYYFDVEELTFTDPFGCEFKYRRV